MALNAALEIVETFTGVSGASMPATIFTAMCFTGMARTLPGI